MFYLHFRRLLVVWVQNNIEDLSYAENRLGWVGPDEMSVFEPAFLYSINLCPSQFCIVLHIFVTFKCLGVILKNFICVVRLTFFTKSNIATNTGESGQGGTFLPGKSYLVESSPIRNVIRKSET